MQIIYEEHVVLQMNCALDDAEKINRKIKKFILSDSECDELWEHFASFESLRTARERHEIFEKKLPKKEDFLRGNEITKIFGIPTEREKYV